MQRRRLLGGLAIGTGGLFAGYRHLSGPRYPSVDVRDVTDASPYGYSFDVEVLEEFSRSSPARLEITLRNETDRERTLDLGHSPPFSRVSPREDDLPVALIPEQSDAVTAGSPPESGDAFPPEEPVDGCWRLRESPRVWPRGTERTLAPSEAISRSYALYDGPNGLRCLPSGTHRFEVPDYFGDDEPAGFTVRIE